MMNTRKGLPGAHRGHLRQAMAEAGLHLQEQSMGYSCPTLRVHPCLGSWGVTVLEGSGHGLETQTPNNLLSALQPLSQKQCKARPSAQVAPHSWLKGKDKRALWPNLGPSPNPLSSCPQRHGGVSHHTGFGTTNKTPTTWGQAAKIVTMTSYTSKYTET